METVDLGLAGLRIYLGLLMMAHGSQKLFGWFNGDGIRGTAEYFASIRFRRPVSFTILAGLAEAGGGFLLGAGLGMPLGAAILVGALLGIAIAGHEGNGFWNHNEAPGIELPLSLLMIAATFAVTGPGRYSLDAVLGWQYTGPVWGGLAIGGGLLSGLGAMRMRTPRSSPLEEVSQRLAG